MTASETIQGGRALAATCLIAAVALFAALIQYGVTDQFASMYQDPYGVVRHQDRLQAALDGIPAAEPVAFFTDLPMTEGSAQGTYFLTQYGLAPRIVVPEASPKAAKLRYWIGSFSKEIKPDELRGLVGSRPLTMIRNISPASALFVRQGAAQ